MYEQLFQFGGAWMRRAETTTEIILFGTLFTAAIIALLWGVQNIHPVQVDIERAQADIEQLSSHFSAACNSHLLDRTYAPNTQEGVLNISGEEFCVHARHVTLCAFTVCDLGEHTLNLTGTSFIRIVKTQESAGEEYEITAR